MRMIEERVVKQYDWPNILLGIEACASMLATVEELRILTLSIPRGHCSMGFSTWERSVGFWARVLQPILVLKYRANSEVGCQKGDCKLVGMALEEYLQFGEKGACEKAVEMEKRAREVDEERVGEGEERKRLFMGIGGGEEEEEGEGEEVDWGKRAEEMGWPPGSVMGGTR